MKSTFFGALHCKLNVGSVIEQWGRVRVKLDSGFGEKSNMCFSDSTRCLCAK